MSADEPYGSVGLIVIRGGAEVGISGLIPLLFGGIDDVVDDENENERFAVCGCCCDGSGGADLLLLLLDDDEKHRSGVCNGGRFRRFPCMKASEEL